MVLATGNSLAKQLLELISDWLHGVLVYGLAVRASEMTHQDDRLGTVVERVLNGRHRGDDSATPSSLFHATKLVFLRQTHITVVAKYRHNSHVQRLGLAWVCISTQCTILIVKDIIKKISLVE